MLSEHLSFPVDPNANTIENCLNNVDRHADIFVLVIGSRFGSEGPNGQSITNLEYSAAAKKGIPVYVFVEEDVLSQYRIWKENKDVTVKYPGIDNVKLFDFVDQVKSNSGRWIFPFKDGVDVINTLRRQWAVLFAELLKWKRSMNSPTLPERFQNLPAVTRRILLERGDFWEFRLFSELLKSGIEEIQAERADVKLKLYRVSPHRVPAIDFGGWANGKIQHVLRIVENVNRLFAKESFESAFGAPGVAGDADEILHRATRIIDAIREIMSWMQSVRSADVHPALVEAVECLANMASNVPDYFEQFFDDYCSQLARAIAIVPVGGQVGDPVTINATFHMRLKPDSEADFDNIMERLSDPNLMQRILDDEGSPD